MADTTPEWQHGYRCHGFWIGVVRWGYVSIHAHRFGKLPKTGGYKWEFTPRGIIPQNVDPADEGDCDTLRQAKRCVERRFIQSKETTDAK